MRVGEIKSRFGYADDVSILGIESTIAESAVAAKSELVDLMEWA